MSKNNFLIILVILGFIGDFFAFQYSQKNKTVEKINETKQDWKWNEDWNNPTPPLKVEILPKSEEKKPDVSPPVESTSSYEDALKKAKASGKNVFLFFEGSNCEVCKKTKLEVLSKDEVKKAMSKYVFCDLDANAERRVSNKYKVRVVPTFFIVDEKGKVIKERTGYITDANLIVWLNS